jgi:hypothetical protein
MATKVKKEPQKSNVGRLPPRFALPEDCETKPWTKRTTEGESMSLRGGADDEAISVLIDKDCFAPLAMTL